MVKSVFYYFSDLSLVFINPGFAAHVTISPLLYVYLIAFPDTNFRFREIHFLHFIPSVLIVLLSVYLPEKAFWQRGGYEFSLYGMFAYFPFSLYLIYQSYREKCGTQKQVEKRKILWMLQILIGIFIVWAAYFSNYVLRLTPYIATPLIFTLVIYSISFLALKYHPVFLKNSNSYKKTNFSAELISEAA